MFTPQRKSWALSPRVSAGKGKAVAAPPPPPVETLGDDGRGRRGDGDDMEVWRRFREEGLLDEEAIRRRDREALASRILELENELREYQYNMGLLLIEKKDWSLTYEEIRQQFLEAKEMLKLEKSAHINALSDLEKREESLRKTLGVEKQCVIDLEKALREMRGEIAEVKFTSDKKMAEALVLEANITEKSLEVERKLHSADAKLTEASMKCSEVDRKLKDVEARERKVQRELFSLNSERKNLKKDIAEQRDHLRDWERELQDKQKRLVDGQRVLNDREDKVNKDDHTLKKKEEELEEASRLIDVTTNSLKNKEDDVNTRLKTLASKEKDVDVKMINLEKQERDLLEVEENLNAREREEIQKLVDDHNKILEAKKKDLESELDKKRKSFDEEIKAKLDAAEKQRKEISRKEEHISKREQTLESKMEKLNMTVKDLDIKSKSLKKWEETLKYDEKKLQEEKKKVIKDSEELMVSKNDLESLRAAIQSEEQKILREKENLKLTKEERDQHLQLQSKLKQEIEEYRMFKASLVKEREALRDEREKFERDWEVLDEKKVALEADIKKASVEKERFEKQRHNEQERLKTEELQSKAEIESQLGDLRLKKEAFENTMEHERAVAREDVERQLADVARERELRKHDLEMNMQKKQEDVEKKLREKEKDFEVRRTAELNRITSLINLNDSKIQKIKVEQNQLERDKKEISVRKKELEEDQAEIHKDIDSLRMLSKNLKDQRSAFAKEKELFLAAAERCKTCQNCGVKRSELEALDLQTLTTEIDNADILLPSLVDHHIEEHMKGSQTKSPQGTGSRSYGKSLLQKCSSLFKFSPGKNGGHSTEGRGGQHVEFGERIGMAASEDTTDQGTANNSFDAPGAERGGYARINEDLERIEKAGGEPEPSLGVGDNSINIAAMADSGLRQADEQNETEGSSRPAKDSEPQLSTQQHKQPSKRGRPRTIKRNLSVKAVVEDAKAILGESADLKMDEEQNGDAKDSRLVDEESQGAGDKVAANSRHKRRCPQTSEMTTSELETEDSEAQSQSVSLGGRRKRRQISATVVQTPGERHYNFRRSTVARSVTSSQAALDQVKGHKTSSHQALDDTEMSKGDHLGEGASKWKSTARSGVEVSSKRYIAEIQPESNAIKSVEISERMEEHGDEVDGAAAAATRTSEPATPSAGSSTTGDDLEDNEDVEKHNASIGKKLWNFLTT